MTESVPVRCPECRREHLYAPPAFPCSCGTPVTPPLLRGATAAPVVQRTWAEEWVTVRCPACGRQDQWPQPELGCTCGTALRIPVKSVATGPPPAETLLPPHIPLPPTAPTPRPAFHPVTIRTARDAVTAAALYLKWLGYREVHSTEPREDATTGLRAPGLVAQVEPTTRPANVRDVECLWLSGLSASAIGVYFTLAGYTDEARQRADTLAVPLFVLDLTGTPQPVNSPADELVTTGA
ncbi:hypothetical protein DSC45_33425 [Streptomyces sp. YIM 130001]|uniref:hypothetical protein n=1 Tax=Streptomyces sp. YIM 130001 TaxID=2259644 RepID=UPI000E6563A8|nr:hypothetical protein [Streptomyces sp. YIM 130001]RII08083.1 hypothetical protein DSC45_33425 [Streptomyces sp. YIM 130001]